MLVQRDYGDRTNRKHARLKYTIDDHGIDWFREQVEERYDYCLIMIYVLGSILVNVREVDL